MVECLLGLLLLAPRRMPVVDPALPDWLPEITVHNVLIGTARASLRFCRDVSGHTEVEVLEAESVAVVRPDPTLLPGRDRLGPILSSPLTAPQFRSH